MRDDEEILMKIVTLKTSRRGERGEMRILMERYLMKRVTLKTSRRGEREER